MADSSTLVKIRLPRHVEDWRYCERNGGANPEYYYDGGDEINVNPPFDQVT
jgi:hypothetical protein